MTTNLQNEDLSEIVKHLEKIDRHNQTIEKKVDFLYTELASFENMEGRIASLEEQIKLLRQHGIEIKKSIEETVNDVGKRGEDKVEELSDQLESKKVIQLKPRGWLSRLFKKT